MRPRPSEVVQGVRSVLKDVVAPAVLDAHARGRLEECRIALAQVDWDDAGFLLAARNRSLAQALEAAHSWVGDADLSLAPEDTFSAHQLTYERLAGTLVTTLSILRARLVEAPGDTEARQVQAALLDVL